MFKTHLEVGKVYVPYFVILDNSTSDMHITMWQVDLKTFSPFSNKKISKLPYVIEKCFE